MVVVVMKMIVRVTSKAVGWLKQKKWVESGDYIIVISGEF
jgi:hypothetical protein